MRRGIFFLFTGLSICAADDHPIAEINKMQIAEVVVIDHIEELESFDPHWRANRILDIYFSDSDSAFRPHLVPKISRKLTEARESTPRLIDKIVKLDTPPLSESSEHSFHGDPELKKFTEKLIASSIQEVLEEKEAEKELELRKKKYALIGTALGILGTLTSGAVALITNLTEASCDPCSNATSE